jgi:hypothetical protein
VIDLVQTPAIILSTRIYEKEGRKGKAMQAGRQ